MVVRFLPAYVLSDVCRLAAERFNLSDRRYETRECFGHFLLKRSPETGQSRLQGFMQTSALGVADFADPAILQSRKRGAEQGQQGYGSPLQPAAAAKKFHFLQASAVAVLRKLRVDLYLPCQQAALLSKNAPMPSCASAARAFIDITSLAYA